MQKITLTVLEEDILFTSYLNHHDCAITRALRRAGLKGYIDNGVEIIDDEEGRTLVNMNNKSYEELVEKVIDMYSRKIPVKTFEHTLKIY